MSEATTESTDAGILWDGRSLELPRAWPSMVALELDGEYFCDVAADAQGQLRYDIPFSPSGHARLGVVVRAERHGEPLHANAFAIEIGVGGVHPASAPIALAPLDSMPLIAGAGDFEREIAIVIPIYNAADAVERCIASVLAHTTGNSRLILIDDASSDPAIAPLIARHAQRARVEVLHNAQNLGFTATVNRGMQLAGNADVVLLNADTEVAANWLQGLRQAAYAHADIATATAVSDNAGAFSVPELEHENTWPSAWQFTHAARALWQEAGHVMPELPTGNGFCMYIRREVLDAIGLFDAEAFPQGYGEENDFCQRAAASGWRHVIAGKVLVHHERSLSFGIERRMALGERGMQVLRERWPRYEAEVGATLFSFERRVLDWRVRRIYADANGADLPAPRVLRLAPVGGDAILDDYTIWHAAIHRDTLVLVRGSASGPVIVEHAPLDACDAAMLSVWLVRHAIEIVDCAIDPRDRLVIALREAAATLGIAELISAAGGTPAASDYLAAVTRNCSFVEAWA